MLINTATLSGRFLFGIVRIVARVMPIVSYNVRVGSNCTDWVRVEWH